MKPYDFLTLILNFPELDEAKMWRMRGRIIQEIFNTEKDYVEDMELVIEVVFLIVFLMYFFS